MTVFDCHAFLFWNKARLNCEDAAAYNSHECGMHHAHYRQRRGQSPAETRHVRATEVRRPIFHYAAGCAEIESRLICNLGRVETRLNCSGPSTKLHCIALWSQI